MTEIVVVIAIVVLLMAILLPAISSARGKARQVQCKNNSRQLSLAVIEYVEKNRRYPASGYWNAQGTRGLRSWIVEVLPSLDRPDLVEQWDKKRPYDDVTLGNYQATSNQQLSQINLEILTCPDDDSAVSGGGDLSYAVNGGFAYTAIADCPWAPHPGGATEMDFNGDGKTCPDSDVDQPRDQVYMKQMGLFFLENWPPGSGTSRFHTPGSVVDGLSNTILLSENVRTGVSEDGEGGWANPSASVCAFYASGHVCNQGNCSAATVDYANANNRSNSLTRDEAINGSLKLPEGSPWVSSWHRDRGVHASFCDGSVRFLSEKIDGEVFAKLVTPAGKSIRGPLSQSALEDDYF